MHSPAKVAVPGQVCPHCGLNTMSFMAWDGRGGALYHCCAPTCGKISSPPERRTTDGRARQTS